MLNSICFCDNCKKTLLHDEVAMTKKLINRGTTRYFCFSCLAHAFEVTEEDLKCKACYFKESGCTLFLNK